MHLTPCSEHLGNIDLDQFKTCHIYTTSILADESIGTLKISQDPDEEAKESFDIPWQLRDDEYIYSQYVTRQVLSLSLSC